MLKTRFLIYQIHKYLKMRNFGDMEVEVILNKFEEEDPCAYQRLKDDEENEEISTEDVQINVDEVTSFSILFLLDLVIILGKYVCERLEKFGHLC